MKSFFTPQPGVCVQCHRPLGQEIYCADLPKEGIELEFCSQYCAHNYWGEFKRHCEKTAGKPVQTLAIAWPTVTPVRFLHMQGASCVASLAATCPATEKAPRSMTTVAVPTPKSTRL